MNQLNFKPMKEVINKFLHLKHITGAQRQNISSNSKVLIRFFERNQSDAFKQLNDLFKEQYDIELIEVFKQIKNDINHIAIKMEDLEEEYLKTK